MPTHEYGAEHITVLEFDESVRKRPGMYFGVGPGDPRLPTQVLQAVIRHAMHPAPRIAECHTPTVVAEITADLAFTVTDDQAILTPGYFGSLLTPERWSFAAAAAVSNTTTVEVWKDGRGLRQELAGMRPTGPPTEFPAPDGTGTRVSYRLDADYMGATTLTTDIDAHGPDCTGPTGPGTLVIHDRRPCQLV